MLPPPEEAARCSSTLLNVSSGQRAAAPPPRSVASVPRAYHLLWFSPPYPLQSSTSENVNLLGKEPLGCSSSLVASTPAPLCVPYSQLHPTERGAPHPFQFPGVLELAPCLHAYVLASSLAPASGPPCCCLLNKLQFALLPTACPQPSTSLRTPLGSQPSASIHTKTRLSRLCLTFATNYLPGLLVVFPFVKHRLELWGGLEATQWLSQAGRLT